jgi:hypothetical protein
MLKLRRIRRAGRVAHVGERKGAYRVVERKTKREGYLKV